MVAVVVIAAIVLFVMIGVGVMTRLEQQRTRALEASVAPYGWTVTPRFGRPDEYRSYALVNRRLPEFRNRIAARHAGLDVDVFDYENQRGVRSSTSLKLTVAAIPLPLERPRLIIDKRTEIGYPLREPSASIGATLGLPSKVRLWCSDVEFARALLTPEVRALLGQMDRGGIEVGDCIMVWLRRLPSARQLEIMAFAALVWDALQSGAVAPPV